MATHQKTEEESARTPCFIAKCEKCHQIVACAVNDEQFRKDALKSLLSWAKQGLEVGTVTVAEVRTGQWCECPRRRGK